jgi:hypothetical protein
MSKKQISIVLILDIDICGFFGLEEIVQSPPHGLAFGQLVISAV